MLLVQVPWAKRIMALPFLTMLAPSKRFYADKSRAPKTLLDGARQAALQIHRWLPDRTIVLVADSAFAAIEFLAAVRNHVCVVTRLRLDANLFAFPPQKRKGRGRPPIKGKRLKKLSTVLNDPKLSWQRHPVSLWYGRTNRIVEIASGTAIWYRSGTPPVPIRWLLVRDPKANSNRRLSSPPIAMPVRAISSPGSCRVGRSKSPSRKPAPISVSKPSVSGPTKQFFEPRRRCSPCFLSSPYRRTTSPNHETSRREPPPGIQKHA